MICTCSYKNYNSNIYKTFDISNNNVNYNENYYSKLTPKSSFLEVYHNNIGIISEEENNKYYIEQYYKEVLSKLSVEEVYKELDSSILLCCENNMELCNRHIVAEWIQILLDINVPEVSVDGMQIKPLKRPEYIRYFLEEIMKKNTNMKGFNSLRAVYLFDQSERLEQKTDELERKTGKSLDSYRQAACYLRCDADEAEAEYNKKVKLIKQKKCYK